MPKIIFSCFVCLTLLFSGCAGSAVKDDAAAQNAAYDALASMDRAFNGEPLTVPQAATGQQQNTVGQSGGQQGVGQNPQGSGASQPQQVPLNSSRDKPAWVDTPDSVFSRQRYVSAVGYGTDRRQAERSALANLTGVFGQSIQAELKTTSNYNEAIRSGVIQITENSSVQDAITTSVELDSLMGAQIADVWFDNRNTYYAAAVMERDKSSVLYADLIRSNNRIISDLLAMTNNDKNSLNGYSRYLLAAEIADANRVYANVLTFVGNNSGINTASMKRGDEYRMEAADIARNIPIAVNVEGDRGGRVRASFSRSLSSAGFRSGGTNSRYVLNAVLTMNEADLPNQQNVFIRYVVDASLVDTSDNSVLFPFSFSGREGHLNKSEAEERALRAAENKIAAEYAGHLRNYLSLLLPK